MNKLLKYIKSLLSKIRLRGIDIDSYFIGEDKIYLASADQFDGFDEFMNGADIKQCKKLYCVIGGMGGLNVLSRLEQLDKIVFFDINSSAEIICKIYRKIITNSRNRDELISYFYLREFNSDLYSIENQADYYQLPIDSNYQMKLETILGDETFKKFHEIYYPYIVNPSVDTYKGVSLHVTRMPIFHQAASSAVMTYPFYSRLELKLRKISCVNSFFMGHGWLDSEENFNRVKSHLSFTPVEIIIKPLHQISPEDDAGLYASNIVDNNYQGVSTALSRYNWVVGYSPASDYQKVDYIPLNKRIIPIEKIYSKGEKNTHKSCCEIINEQINIGDSTFLEVIEPHPVHSLKYGFRFYNGQLPISVDEFLNLTDQVDLPNIVGIHILMGSGVEPDKWKKIISKAYKYYITHENVQSLFIFEHNYACLDWPEDDVRLDTLLEEINIDKELLKLAGSWKKFGAVSQTGDETNIRNLCWVLKK